MTSEARLKWFLPLLRPVGNKEEEEKEEEEEVKGWAMPGREPGAPTGGGAGLEGITSAAATELNGLRVPHTQEVIVARHTRSIGAIIRGGEGRVSFCHLLALRARGRASMRISPMRIMRVMRIDLIDQHRKIEIIAYF